MLLILGYVLFVVLCIYSDADIVQHLEANVRNVEWKITQQACVRVSSRWDSSELVEIPPELLENSTVTQLSTTLSTLTIGINFYID